MLSRLQAQLGRRDRCPATVCTAHAPKMTTGPSRGPFVAARGPGYAENDVPHPQLDFALGLTKVKPPVSPCCT